MLAQIINHSNFDRDIISFRESYFETLKTLRHYGFFTLYKSEEKLFYRIQINRKNSFICWEMYHSKDRSNWVKINAYLSLKDVISFKYNKYLSF